MHMREVIFVLPGAITTIILVYFTPKHKVVFKIILLFLFKVVLYLNVLCAVDKN